MWPFWDNSHKITIHLVCVDAILSNIWTKDNCTCALSQVDRRLGYKSKSIFKPFTLYPKYAHVLTSSALCWWFVFIRLFTVIHKISVSVALVTCRHTGFRLIRLYAAAAGRSWRWCRVWCDVVAPIWQKATQVFTGQHRREYLIFDAFHTSNITFRKKRWHPSVNPGQTITMSKTIFLTSIQRYQETCLT